MRTFVVRLAGFAIRGGGGRGGGLVRPPAQASTPGPLSRIRRTSRSMRAVADRGTE